MTRIRNRRTYSFVGNLSHKAIVSGHTIRLHAYYYNNYERSTRIIFFSSRIYIFSSLYIHKEDKPHKKINKKVLHVEQFSVFDAHVQLL